MAHRNILSLFIFAFASFSLALDPFVRIGECPSEMIQIGCLNRRNLCTEDNHCALGQKCCMQPCGLECVAIKRVTKPGQCPPVDPNIMTTCVMGPNSCVGGDGACPGDRKCCKFGCGSVCTDPVPETPKEIIKPGECPPVPKIEAFGPCVMMPHNCVGDAACPGSQICCPGTGCGRTCVAPVPETPKEIIKPGECPPVPKIEAFGPCVMGPHNCVGDAACPGSQICCPGTGCGRTCVAPVPETPKEIIKPGECPPVPKIEAFGPCVMMPHNCVGDAACPGSQKCCPGTECGRTCVAAVLENRAEVDDELPLDEVDYNIVDEQDYNLVDEAAFALGDSSENSQNSQVVNSQMPVWAIALFVVFVVIIVVLIVVQVQLHKISKRAK